MSIVLDNAESVLDPHVASAEGMYAVVEELGQLGGIYLCITSRIYRQGPEHPDLTNKILKQLDFRALSVTLLATGCSSQQVGH